MPILCYLGLPLPGRENEDNNIYYCNINENKLHKYPGFNAPCSPNVVDVSIFIFFLRNSIYINIYYILKYLFIKFKLMEYLRKHDIVIN